MVAKHATPSPAEPGPRQGTFAALGAPNFCLYWIGLVLYVLGQRAEYVTFGWLIWERTQDPLYLGYLGIAQGVPLILFQLGGGVLADRGDRLRLLIRTQLGTALTLSIAFGLTVSDLARVEHLFALAVLSSTFRAFDEPSRMALVPQLIDRARLANAVALGSIPWQTGRVVGPAATGVLIALYGGWIGFGLAALVSFAALGLYVRVRLSGEPPRGDGRGALRQLWDGFSFVGHNFLFGSLIALALFNSVFGMSYVALLPIFADRYFGAGSEGYGLLNAGHGIGSVIGTLAVATLASRIRQRGLVLLIAGAGFGLVLAIFSQSTSLALALVALALAGLCNTFYLTQISTVLQEQVPDELRGRVMSIYGLCWNLIPLGGGLAGALAATFDARFAVLFGSAMITSTALLLLVGSNRLRSIR